MKKKWKSGLSFVLAAALTAGGIGFVNPTVVWAEDVKELENTMEVFAVQPKMEMIQRMVHQRRPHGNLLPT